MRAVPLSSTTVASPPPPCCEHDRSGGVRAYVTIHALRRYGDRILGMEEVLAGLDDLDAVDVMQATGAPIGMIRDWLAFYGDVGARHGAGTVCRDGVGVILQGDRVVTVLSRRWIRR